MEEEIKLKCLTAVAYSIQLSWIIFLMYPCLISFYLFVGAEVSDINRLMASIIAFSYGGINCLKKFIYHNHIRTEEDFYNYSLRNHTLLNKKHIKLQILPNKFKQVDPNSRIYQLFFWIKVILGEWSYHNNKSSNIDLSERLLPNFDDS